MMHPLLMILNVAASVLLLLWSARMVRTGMERAQGPALRTLLKRAPGGWAGMAAAGAALALLLQSATAVGLFAAGFASAGGLGVAHGIAALIGADLGSALIVAALATDLSALAPALILIGAALHLKFTGRGARQAGRVVLGIGLMLIALAMLSAATAPLRDSAILPLLAARLAWDPASAFALAAALAFLLHSSVAAALLLAALAAGGLLPADAAAAMALGVNFGAAAVPWWLTRGMAPPARRIALGAMALRAGAALLALLALVVVAPPNLFGLRPEAEIVAVHVAFNAALALLGLPLVGLARRLAERLAPDAPAHGIDRAHGAESALDPAALRRPRLALAGATRELLRMAEIVEEMLRPLIELIDSYDAPRDAGLRGLDSEVNRRHAEVKLYLAELSRGRLSDEERRRSEALTDIAISLEHAGDLVSKSLLPLAAKKAERGLAYSDEGRAEIARLHARVLGTLELAKNALVSEDIETARELAREKAEMRRLERESHERHLLRLRSGRAESIATSGLHLETARALKEVNSLLVTFGYPILAEHGELRETRLVEPSASRAGPA